MTEREQWLYGGMAVWAILNYAFYWWTKDDWEWIARGKKRDPITEFIVTWSAILFWTIPSTLWIVIKEKRQGK